MSKLQRLIVISLMALLVACTSSEERVAEYIGKGEALLEEGKLVKAKLEFQNALQLDEKQVAAWYGLAQIAEKKAEWKELFGLLNKIRELDPNHLEANLRLGRLYLASGSLDKALELSTKAQELKPNDAQVLSFRAAVFYKLGDNESAVKFANEALKLDPKHIDALAVLATERLAAGKPGESLVFIDAGLVGNERNVPLQFIRIEALTRLGRDDEAEAVFKRLIELYPEIAEFKHRLVRFYLVNKREAEAEQIYRDIAAANPGNVAATLDVVRFVNHTRGADAAQKELAAFIAANPGEMQLRFFLSQLQRAEGLNEAAAETLQTIAQSATNAEDKLQAQGLLAAMQIESGDKKAAMELVARILAEDPRNEQALILKTTQLIEERKLDDAISNARTVLKDSPKSARALLLLGKAHELGGARDLAEDVYARAFEASGQAPNFGLEYARFLIVLQRPERAAGVLEDALRRDGNNLQVLTALARVKVGLGDWAGAQAVADRIKMIDGEQGISEQIQGAVSAGQQDFAKSIEYLKQAQEAAPSAAQPMISLVRAYARTGRMDDAIAFLNSILATNPTNNNARLLKGQLLAMQQNPQGAEEIFEAIIAQEPTNVTAYHSLAMIYTQSNKPEAAMKVLKRGLENNPGDFTLELDKAALLERQQDFEGAIAVYEEVIAARPNADVVANNLASLLSDHRDDQASYQRAYELATRFRDSNIPYYKDTLGWTYYLTGNAERANKYIREAAEALPNLPVVRYHLAMTYMALKDQEAARKEFEKTLELVGDAPFPFRQKIEASLKSMK